MSDPIKHAQEIDSVQGKDSERHISAGSEISAVATSGRIVVVKPSKEPTIDEAARLLGIGLDIILCEGFKQSNTSKIEVHRKGHGRMLEGLTGVVAFVTDEPLDTKLKQFSSEDIQGIADLIENDFIQSQSNSLDLFVNEKKVPLSAFPYQIINNIMLAVTASLKNVGAVRTLELYLRKSPEDGDKQ